MLHTGLFDGELNPLISNQFVLYFGERQLTTVPGGENTLYHATHQNFITAYIKVGRDFNVEY